MNWNAWAAGLFEGEGHISWAKSPKYLVIGLTTTDEDVIRKFLDVVGMGAISGPYRNVSDANKPVWKWRAYGVKKVQYLGRLWWPYLGTRRQRRLASLIANTMPLVD